MTQRPFHLTPTHGCYATGDSLEGIDMIHGLWELRDFGSNAPTAGFLNYKLDIRKRLDYREESDVVNITSAFLAHWRETFPFGYRRYAHTKLPRSSRLVSSRDEKIQ